MAGPLLERSGCGFAEIAAAASTADLKDTMVTFGMIADSGASPLDLDDGKLTCGEAEIDGALNHDGTTAGFFGVTPTTRPGATAEIKASLVLLGLLQGTSATALDLDGGDLTAAAGTFTGAVEIDGAFNHDGTTFGALAATPAAQQTAIANYSKTTLSSPGFASPGFDMVDITSTTNNGDAGGMASAANTNFTAIETKLNGALALLRTFGFLAT